ncbi:MAG: hypothetical protein Q7S88_01995 [Candidatus Daviesbacteria bacterium]|nr:hypothetical protein [Candidatus Daviesbacteria bacterium]
MAFETSSSLITGLPEIWSFFKLILIMAFGLYFIFSLIVVKQVRLMTDTLMTEVGPILRAVSIIYAGLALGIIMLLVGYLF